VNSDESADQSISKRCGREDRGGVGQGGGGGVGDERLPLLGRHGKGTMADGLFELLERDGALATPPRRRAYYLFEYVGHALCAKVAGYVERVSKREKAGEWQ